MIDFFPSLIASLANLSSLLLALSPDSLRIGPRFTLTKWVFAVTPLVVALLGYALRVKH